LTGGKSLASDDQNQFFKDEIETNADNDYMLGNGWINDMVFAQKER
jgi:cellulose synthase/poly-beta-1,6-N-acetylglucosamine synthase-like glycosyltransferase